jgi:hypothetical protein
MAWALIGLAAPASAQCGDQQSVTVGGMTNPYLAAQPDGTTSKGDVAPGQSPALAPIAIDEGDVLHFASVVGNVRQPGQATAPGPDGDPSAVVNLTADLGISGTKVPLDCLLGVFLPVRANPGAAPQDSDFSTSALRDYDTLQPELYQLFYIGDGLRSNGTPQSVVAPDRAIKLFLGSSDDGSWTGNLGMFDLDVLVDPRPVQEYCSPKLSAQGCLPMIGWSGTPDTVGPKDFLITCANVMPNRYGFVFYGYTNNALPFQGGTLCVWQNMKRMRYKFSAGTGTCQGVFTMDFDAYIRTGADPNLVPGAEIYAQWWMRDPQSPSKTGLSDALHIVLCQ